MTGVMRIKPAQTAVEHLLKAGISILTKSHTEIARPQLAAPTNRFIANGIVSMVRRNHPALRLGRVQSNYIDHPEQGIRTKRYTVRTTHDFYAFDILDSYGKQVPVNAGL